MERLNGEFKESTGDLKGKFFEELMDDLKRGLECMVYGALKGGFNGEFKWRA